MVQLSRFSAKFSLFWRREWKIHLSFVHNKCHSEIAVSSKTIDCIYKIWDSYKTKRYFLSNKKNLLGSRRCLFIVFIIISLQPQCNVMKSTQIDVNKQTNWIGCLECKTQANHLRQFTNWNTQKWTQTRKREEKKKMCVYFVFHRH